MQHRKSYTKINEIFDSVLDEDQTFEKIMAISDGSKENTARRVEEEKKIGQEEFTVDDTNSPRSFVSPPKKEGKNGIIKSDNLKMLKT